MLGRRSEMARVVLAMSGGVDSSVAAYLLKEQGHEVVGLFMRTGAFTGPEEGKSKTCCAVSDALDARAVADQLNIPFFALDFERDFDRIQDYFADEYLSGRTPNPCVLCNVWLKFGKLWSYGKQVGADYVATGHYAQIVPGHDGSPRLARAVDREKDQTYVLSGLRRELLRHILLPVGAFPKSRIRELALELHLPVHDKPDSQEICFVPNDNYLDLVRARRPDRDTSGFVVDESDQVLAEHAGIESFTIGQRRGLGVALGTPQYVVQIEPSSRKVTIGPRTSLEKPGLLASRLNWHIEEPPSNVALRCCAQIRARHRAVPATAERIADDQVRVRFDEPQRAVTPGQVVTLYDGDWVMGGGWIDSAIDT